MPSWYDARLPDDDQFPNWVKYQAQAKKHTEEIYALLKSLNPDYKRPDLKPWPVEELKRHRASIEARARRQPATPEETARYWARAREQAKASPRFRADSRNVP